MSLRDNELARRQDGRLELRPQPLRVRWSFNELLTADGHELRAVFTCSARAIPDAIERRMLEEVLLGSKYSLSDDDLAGYFEPALRAAAGKAAGKHPAAQWMDGEAREAMIEALQAAAKPVAFGCGVELLPPFQVDLQSPTFQRQRLRAVQQALAEKQTAGQIEHVQRSAELLKQFQAIRQSTPELSPGRVLQQISPADRGAVLRTLLLASAKQGRPEQLWAVAGPYLVRIDAQSGSPPRPQLLPLPPVLGPLRSVQPAEVDGKRRLLVGARSGFMAIDPENPSEPQAYTDSAVASALGFNRVVCWANGRRFAASHGDAGIVSWDHDRTDAPAATLRPDRLGIAEPTITSMSGSTHVAGPRNLQVLDETALVFSAGSKLFVSDLADVQPVATDSASEIVAILPDERQMIVVHEDGTLCALDKSSRKMSLIGRRGQRVRAAGALPWLGTSRLLLAGEAGPIDCIGFDDQLVTQYQSAHAGIRVLAGSPDLIAAVSADRQRLILWQSWDARQPLTELYLTGLTRHRIADVDFG